MTLNRKKNKIKTLNSNDRLKNENQKSKIGCWAYLGFSCVLGLIFFTALSTSSCSDVGLSDKMSVVVDISRSLFDTAVETSEKVHSTLLLLV